MKAQKLKIAIQKSGRITDQTLELFANMGLEIQKSNRSLMTTCHNFPLEILFLREKDIPEMVADGIADLGICGQNTFIEKEIKLPILEKLNYGKCRLSLAIPKEKTTNFNFKGKRIATSYPKTLKKYLKQKNISAEIIEISGSVEIAPNLDLADGICDLVSTGSTLKKNNLIEVEQVLCSEAILFGKKNFKQKEQKTLDNFLLRMRSVLLAQKYKYIVMNLKKSKLTDLKSILTGLKSPTISPLWNENWISVSTVVEENFFWETIEKLKQIGAEGILVQPIEKMIL